MSLPNPVPPAQFQAVIPQANASVCEKLVNALIKFPLLFYQWYSWAFDNDGNWSTDAKANMGIATGALLAPGGVSATDGTYEDKVVITWSAVSNATYYEVFRATADDSAAATKIGTGSALTFTDTSGVAGYADNTVFYYWVKARNATDTSAFSASDTGLSGTNVVTFGGSGTWTVPVGITHIEVEAWGTGGPGGSGQLSPWSIPGGTGNGGGGGSGQYRHAKLIAVTVGDVLTVSVAPTATGGSASVVDSAMATLMLAVGGSPGGSLPSVAGGAGGTGGSTTGTVITTTSGNAGSNGSGGTGGAGGAAIGGYGAGGTGGNNGLPGQVGGIGRVVITFPGAS